MSSPQRRKRVLIVDGGGFRGLGALHIINHLTKAKSQDQKPCELFDMMCGSSVGGLISILLGRLKLDCATAITIYKELTQSFCGKDEEKFYNKLLDKDFLETNEFDVVLANIIRKHGGQPDLPMISEGQSTKTFVTVVAGEPDYSNRTHLIRSYPTPASNIGSLSPPAKHIWLVREAVRATLSSPMYMPPAKIEPMYGFSDAGFAGFNNPVERARKECKMLWPTENLDTFVFVSVGTGLGSSSRTAMMGRSIVTERHAAPLVKPMMDKISIDLHTREKEEKALAISRHLLTIALETQDAHEVHDKLSQLQSGEKASYYRLNPTLGLAEIDLCDCFHDSRVERAVNEWADGEGKALITQIAEKPATSIAPRDMEPPKPEKGTVNAGYNPQLDKKRPSTMSEYLQFYHVLFIVDNSKSMHRMNKWNETREALVGIAKYALDHKSGEIDLTFLHSNEKTASIMGGESMLALFNAAKLERGTPTGKVLQKVLDEHLAKLDQAIDKPEYTQIRPLDIIVLTDGRPDRAPAIKDVLAAAVKRMKENKHHPNSVGVQFVQIGDDKNAKKALQKLIYSENGHMVDTVLYTEKLTSERLERILLGGLHPNIRLQHLMPQRAMSRQSWDTVSIKDGDGSDSDSGFSYVQ
ncbi:FabD/lysophospholipase-like protein [Phlegmacium glaucopus]|nr:FabD/lysophospholipase-like protein [Phlegmacium glaucopus]